MASSKGATTALVLVFAGIERSYAVSNPIPSDRCATTNTTESPADLNRRFPCASKVVTLKLAVIPATPVRIPPPDGTDISADTGPVFTVTVLTDSSNATPTPLTLTSIV